MSDDALGRFLAEAKTLPEIDPIEYFGTREKAEDQAIEDATRHFGSEVRIVGWETLPGADHLHLRLQVDAKPESNVFYGLAQVDSTTVRAYFSLQPKEATYHPSERVAYSSMGEMLEDHLYPLRLPPDWESPSGN